MPRTLRLPPPDSLLTSDEAAAYLKCSKRWIYKLSRNGQITTYKLGRSNRYDRNELAALVTRRSA